MPITHSPTKADESAKGVLEEIEDASILGAHSQITPRTVIVARIKHKAVQRKLAKLQLELENPSLSTSTLRVHLRALEEVKQAQKSVMDQIIDLLPDDLDNDFVEDEAFQTAYTITAAQLEALNVQPPIAVREIATMSHPQLAIPVPKFDGQYEQWPKFKAIFTDLMKRTNVSDAVKLHHLNNALTGNAAGILNASIISSNNFNSAWEILESRFENPRVIVDKHISGLLQLKPVQKESAKSLRDLMDKCKSHVDGLHFMNKPIDATSNLIITHILVSCLDIETRKLWEHTVKAGEFPELNSTLEFIRKQCEVLEHCVPEAKPKLPSTKAYTTVVPKAPAPCVMCSEQHPLHKCPTFLALSVTAKKAKLTELKRCFNCLGVGHQTQRCPSKWTCRICRQKHHTLLHVESSVRPTPSQWNTQSVANSGSPALALNVNNGSTTTVLLSTVLLHIMDDNGTKHHARALLDSGSQANFITGRLAQLLRLPCQSVNIPLNGIGGSTGTNVKQKVQATVWSRSSSFSRVVEFLVLSKPAIDMPRESFDIRKWKLPKECVLADPSFNVPSSIDMILGAEHFFDLLEDGRISLGAGLPTLQATKFGWIVSGSATVINTSTPTMCAVAMQSTNLEKLMKQFFAIEDLSDCPSWSVEERLCEEHYTQTTTRDDNGRYMVRLPRKPETAGTLGESKTIALRRFLAIERRLQREPDTQKAYIEFMEEYLQLGHMSKVQSTDTAKETYYLPHHPVFKADSTTTKCRIVFDASSATASGVSLNDTLMVGPTIQEDAFSILLRFRTKRVAVTADVAKMYRQVWLHPEDRSLQRILWRKSPNDPIQEYELNTVTYGTASAPFLAVRSLKQAFDDHAQEFPIAAARFNDFYVDDFVSGEDTTTAAQILQNQMEQLCNKAGFAIRKWASNEPVVLSRVEEQNLATSPFSSNDSEGALATLGLVWDPSSDTLRFKFNIPNTSEAITKTTVLSCIARIYDPLGIVDPVKAMAKQFMQHVWSLTNEKAQPLGWKDELPSALQIEWMQFQSQLEHLQNIQIPRIAIGRTSVNLQLHLFCDASEKGYAACCYVRSEDENGHVTMQLFVSKSKVTPLKSKLSIARLELCAAHLSSQLYERIKKSVPLAASVVFWTDSMTVIHWLRAPPNSWKPFVANRVSQIQQITEGCNWRHIPGVDNPADLASRGCLSLDLLRNPLWWQGPPWIYQPEEFWPNSSTPSSTEAINAEQRASTVACTVTNVSPNPIFNLYSSFSKLRRITAYCIQFMNRCTKRRSYHGKGLTTEDLKEAEDALCRLAQRDCFNTEMIMLRRKEPVSTSSKLKWLHPRLGSDGILRVGGRLDNSTLHEDMKHPLIVPNGHPLANMIMQHFHLKLLHGGPQLMLNSSRQRYWIIGGRNVARKIHHQCHTCFRARPSSIETIMADLPAGRVQAARPFSVVGVDYCGPVMVKGPHRRAVATKAYVAIFVCFVTRAVHIELVTNLTTEAFLSALRRFVSRRGIPSEIHSDNATNFKGAQHMLCDLYKLFHSADHKHAVQSWTLEKGITWKFIPPRAPHFGGLWEAAVRSTKHHLLRVLGTSTLSFEDMTTLLVEIECCLNSRPITPMTDDPTDLTALTPGHFLIGSPLHQIPDVDVRHIPENRLNHWRYVQQLMRRFWDRWHREYLQQLQTRAKWLNPGKDMIIPGALVLIKEDNVPSTRWPLARIVECHPGRDGCVRVVTLRTSKGVEITRPVVKICVLPKFG